MEYLTKLVQDHLAIRCHVWVFSNSQLIIYFLICIFKHPQHHSNYYAIEDESATERALRQPVVFYHISRDSNCVTDNMARWVLYAKASVTYWDGQMPKDAPGNQMEHI